ncbi:hypothetical protein H4R19_000375 [Coemansia spiralis]|nr:hypothetical protein H4R19_000375 [Coemansia spiralis]
MTGSVPAIDTRFHSSTSSRGGSAASSPGPAMSVSLTSACSSQRPMLPPLAQHLPGMLGLSAPAQVTAPQLPPAVLPLSAPAGKLAMPVQPTLQILGATGGVASACDEDETLSRQPVRQMYGSDGRLYIEYQPDTNVVFLPVSLPVDRVVRGVVRVPRRRKAAGRTAAHEWAKPHNAFIRYRSWKLEAIKRLYPNANQIDLSRIAAEHWRNEDPQIKDRFQQQYRAELEIYHGRQKIQNMAAEHNARLYHPEPVPHHSPLAAPELPRRRSSSAPHGATKPHSVKHLVH